MSFIWSCDWCLNKHGMKKRVYDKPRTLNQQVPDSGVMEPDRGVKIALVFDETNQAISRTHKYINIFIYVRYLAVPEFYSKLRSTGVTFW